MNLKDWLKENKIKKCSYSYKNGNLIGKTAKGEEHSLGDFKIHRIWDLTAEQRHKIKLYGDGDKLHNINSTFKFHNNEYIK